MFVTEEEAAAMYARAFRKWQGPKAKSLAKTKIRKLRARDDDKGVAIWQRVVAALEREESATFLRTRRSMDPISTLVTRFRTGLPTVEQSQHN